MTPGKSKAKAIGRAFSLSPFRFRSVYQIDGTYLPYDLAAANRRMLRSTTVRLIKTTASVEDNNADT